MALLAVGDYPHNIIIEDSKISVSDLSDDIRIAIQDFIKRHRGYSLKEGQDSGRVLMAYSNLIAQRIYDYYVDDKDQSVEIEGGEAPSKKEIKEIVKDIKESEQEEEEVEAPKPAETPIVESTVIVTTAESIIGPAPAAADPAPTPEPEPAPVVIPTSRNEKALFDLFSANISENITTDMLKEKGFNTGTTGPLSIRGCKVGDYRLSKDFSEKVYKLSKV